ncbi:disulfide bond formation protein B [Aquabacterium sp.]|uniref:disulfide bond formation protein B n=1 Tax=Aquabacterium sp. TaxID=1872578 RepID=UPI002CE339EE|nr:disulfide bond formation protein B [Aquabacterium sp.]HSW03190.1 disulfide bond formation protein B [Aquabacterium sp.]
MTHARERSGDRAGARPARVGSLLAAMALVSFGAVGAALVTQHHFDMMPCPWCVLQRVIFVAIGLAALLGLAWRSGGGQRIVAGLALLLAGSGIAAALWQHFVAAASASCNQTLADRIVGALQLDSLLPEVFAAYANCADAKVNLFGVPYEFWSLALFLLIALAAVRVLIARTR